MADPARLLEALLQVTEAAGVEPEALAVTLRELLEALPKEKPAMREGPTAGEAIMPVSIVGTGKTHLVVERPPPRMVETARRTAHPVRREPTRQAANGHAPAPEWVELRTKVNLEAQRQGLPRAALAKTMRLNASSVRVSLAPSGRPGPAFVAKVRRWLDAQAAQPPATSGQANGAAPPPAPSASLLGPANGKAGGKPAPVRPQMTVAAWAPVKARLVAALNADPDFDVTALARQAGVALGALENALDGRGRPDEVVFDRLTRWLDKRGPDPREQLAEAVRAKRRRVALTTSSIAQAAGVDVTELDAVIAGEAVPEAAAERLAAWASAS